MKKLIPLSILFSASLALLPASYAQTFTRDAKDNTVKTIVFEGEAGPALENAESLLHGLLELGKQDQLKLKYTHPAANGLEVSKYALWHNNIPVEHGAVTIMVVNNRITAVNANMYKPLPSLGSAPTITEEQALNVALGVVNAKQYMWESSAPKRMTSNAAFQYPKATLVWVEDFTNNESGKELHLAYRFEIFAKEPISNDRIYVDAQTSKVLLKDPLMKHIAATGQSVYSGNVGFETYLLSPGTYSLEDTGRNVYTYDLQGGTNFGSAVDFTNNSTSWGKDYSIDAHWGTSMVYDYWKKKHNRLSYDSAGSDIISFLNYDISYNNAFWTGYFMVYGNGTGMFNSGFEPLVALDVCSHELAHGICQHTAGLVYNRESGAMNEGFSDIWGAVVENYAAPDKQMWSVGEELRVGALRSMSNPNLFTDPDCHSGIHWVNVVGCTPNGGNDQCGVHTNSGVLNYWFYLLVEGGKGKNDLNNDFEVSGIGVEKAANIAYAAELSLNPTDDYIACRAATISAAVAMYGNCSREVEAVTRAWHAVGVGAAFMPCAPQIGFAIQDTIVNKVVTGVACPSSKTIAIPMRVIGTPVGGNATVTINGTGNVNGGDYSIPANQLTFNAGSSAPQNVQVNILDNGDVTKDKLLKLYFTIAQNGSNATTSYTYDTCYITILGSRTIPDTGNSVVIRVNNADIKSKGITPFFSRNALARTQFIITAEELHLAGVKPNEPISALEFNVTEKNSGLPFNDFKLKIDPTNIKDLSSGNPVVTTVYHNSNYNTQVGWNRMAFSAPLVWNGTDNLAIETCFTNANASLENDYVLGIGTNNYASTIAHAGSGSGGCNLSFSSGFNYFSVSKPVVRLVQSTAPLEVEKAISSSRRWEIHPGQNLYFHNDTNGKVIANVVDSKHALGCSDVSITAQGAGLTAMSAPYNSVNRSLKEFSLQTTNNLGGEEYTLTLFFDSSELSGVNLAKIKVLATTAAQASQMNKDNSQIVTPVLVQTGSVYSFKAEFKGIRSAYFLVDNNINLPDNVLDISKRESKLQVVNNPFKDRIIVGYHLATATVADVRLFDITGKVLLSGRYDLQAGRNNFEINTNNVLLPSGNYVLQVITGSEILTQKMVKQ
ncbi:MAG TPA: M4 family metallopeptidase [Flavipsychrobacter sp.]